MNEATIEQAIGKIQINGGQMPLDDFELWVLNNVFGASWDTYKVVTGRLIYALEDRKLIRMILTDSGFGLKLR